MARMASSHINFIKVPSIQFYPFSLLSTGRISILGGSLKIKMADHGEQRSTFIVKHDGCIDFSINEQICVQEPGKVSVFSCQDKTDVANRELNPGL